MQNLLIDRPSEEEKFEIMKKMYYSFPESSSGRYSLPDLRPMGEVYSDFLKRGDSLIVLRSGEEIVGHDILVPRSMKDSRSEDPVTSMTCL